MTKLYVKSRQLRQAVLLLLVLGIIAWAWGQYQLHLPSLRTSETVLVPVILVVPLASAIVIGLSTRTWLSDIESISPRRLAWWRLAHALILCAIGAAFLVPAMDSGHSSYGALAALRNILGYTGLAYLCASVAGGELSWMLPLAYALPAPLFGVNEDRSIASWAWSLQPAGSYTSWVWALVFIVIGIGAFVAHAPRASTVSSEDEQ